MKCHEISLDKNQGDWIKKNLRNISITSWKVYHGFTILCNSCFAYDDRSLLSEISESWGRSSLMF